jgi:hypothetical protein
VSIDDAIKAHEGLMECVDQMGVYLRISEDCLHDIDTISNKVHDDELLDEEDSEITMTVLSYLHDMGMTVCGMHEIEMHVRGHVGEIGAQIDMGFQSMLEAMAIIEKVAPGTTKYNAHQSKIRDPQNVWNGFDIDGGLAEDIEELRYIISVLEDVADDLEEVIDRLE